MEFSEKYEWIIDWLQTIQRKKLRLSKCYQLSCSKKILRRKIQGRICFFGHYLLTSIVILRIYEFNHVGEMHLDYLSKELILFNIWWKHFISINLIHQLCLNIEHTLNSSVAKHEVNSREANYTQANPVFVNSSNLYWGDTVYY